jgi:hypothetical protein
VKTQDGYDWPTPHPVAPCIECAANHYCATHNPSPAREDLFALFVGTAAAIGAEFERRLAVPPPLPAPGLPPFNRYVRLSEDSGE